MRSFAFLSLNLFFVITACENIRREILPIPELVRIEGNSMSPILLPETQAYLFRNAYENTPPQRDELVAFKTPRFPKTVVKRVIAIAGDRLEVDINRLLVNGRLATNSRGQTYEVRDVAVIATISLTPVIPTGKIFVVAEKTKNSQDSTSNGLIDLSQLIGRVEK